MPLPNQVVRYYRVILDETIDQEIEQATNYAANLISKEVPDLRSLRATAKGIIFSTCINIDRVSSRKAIDAAVGRFLRKHHKS